ncbi:UNVERIFIED_CONTAM: hypothetical protein PYX00_009638 [Menopon gallinae]|uniref:Menorin-like domain-containing protein n=1 Tax=Menopon gallinae TaxID=328185 RepID=A0AAW2HC89_9NEOP
MISINLFLFSVFSLLSMAMASEPAGIPSVVDYFDGLKGDMTKLTWAHAVNSQEQLRKALKDESVMMIEADVVLGKLDGENETIPIMAHPPASTSDLSLKQFVGAVISVQETEKKGIKLDFKSTEAFLESLNVVLRVREEESFQLRFPVWLNADILRGPVESQTTPVDADKFLKSSAQQFPSSTLSLGWTTRYGPNITGNYTDRQLDEMETAISRNKVVQPVTLAVRAGIVAQSSNGITSLVEKIDESNKTTLTIWMSTDTDPVDIGKLKNLILTLGKSRVFLDLPEAIRHKLDAENSSAKTPVSGAIGAFVAVLTSVSALFTNAFKIFD